MNIKNGILIVPKHENKHDLIHFLTKVAVNLTFSPKAKHIFYFFGGNTDTNFVPATGVGDIFFFFFFFFFVDLVGVGVPIRILVRSRVRLASCLHSIF